MTIPGFPAPEKKDDGNNSGNGGGMGGGGMGGSAGGMGGGGRNMRAGNTAEVNTMYETKSFWVKMRLSAK